MILYLHGFRSSPQSFKARLLAARLAELGLAHLWRCPQLPVSPREAMALIDAEHPLGPADTVVGSSLGGYYARRVAERTGCRAVLLNPAVRPDRDLAERVGLTTGWHDGTPVDFRPEHLHELAALAVPVITQPRRYLLIAAKGDEILDWRQMVCEFPGVVQCIIEGGDHALSDFHCHVDRVLAFAGLEVPRQPAQQHAGESEQ